MGPVGTNATLAGIVKAIICVVCFLDGGRLAGFDETARLAAGRARRGKT
jgi:hypothetical protein